MKLYSTVHLEFREKVVVVALHFVVDALLGVLGGHGDVEHIEDEVGDLGAAEEPLIVLYWASIAVLHDFSGFPRHHLSLWCPRWPW